MQSLEMSKTVQAIIKNDAFHFGVHTTIPDQGSKGTIMI